MGSECPGIVVVLTCLGCPWEAIRSEDSVGICNPPKKKNRENLDCYTMNHGSSRNTVRRIRRCSNSGLLVS
jgi:hypothetical protein